MKLRAIMVAILIFSSILLATIVYSNFVPKKTTETSLEKEIKELGGKKAYISLKERSKKATYGNQHTLAHDFGTALYKIEGLKGVNVCDRELGYGCFHSFFERAIADKGISIISELDRICKKVYDQQGSCQHGIGHGLLAYLGDEKLTEALDYCTKLASGQSASCIHGVIMEYNNKTMVSDSAIVQRKLSLNMPEEPCNTLAFKFQGACYFSQASLWIHQFNVPIVTIGNFCLEVDNEASKEACYQGLGHEFAAQAKFKANETIESCKKIDGSLGKLHCLIGASMVLSSVKQYTNNGTYLCNAIPHLDSQTCIKKLVSYSDRF